ncbi:MAG: hypothetical protein ACPKPY_13240 [Nitrososphaeraceae archaeon]
MNNNKNNKNNKCKFANNFKAATFTFEIGNKKITSIEFFLCPQCMSKFEKGIKNERK